jgi:hypothetical protein
MEKALNEFMGEVMASMEKKLDEAEHIFVVAYKRKSDDTLIGYHLSTFCQTTQDMLSAKRYTGDNPYDQLATIQKNVKSILDTKETDTGMFAPIRLDVKNTCFKDLSFDDVTLEAVYLDKDIPKHIFKFTKVS